MKVGLITFHSAFNFGGILQSYALFKIISDFGCDIETVDYRTRSQDIVFRKDFHLKKNIMEMLKNCGFLFIRKDRTRRKEKFERFIKTYLNPSKTLLKNYDDFVKNEFDYDILVSGSDIIWNSGARSFRYEPNDSIFPYFLKFGNPLKRISYASSFGNKNQKKIMDKKELLQNYDFLSTREYPVKVLIEEILNRKVEWVCDPTWLLNKNEWLTLPGIYIPNSRKPYILVYALYWDRKKLKQWLKPVKELAAKGMDIVLFSPMNFYSDKEINVIQDAGPIDFLSYLSKAELVVTTTFHGMIFAMNFEIPFFSWNIKEKSRQYSILKYCGLENRIINKPENILEFENYHCDFSYSTKQIEKLRESSMDYLMRALDIPRR